MADPRRLPVGAVTVRADGSAWMKQAHGKDFKWLGEARPASAPPSDIHPSHVTTDLEGDTDVKPIHTWQDENGVEQRIYSPAWHWAKAQFHNEQAEKYHQKVERAYHLAELSLEASGYTSAVDAAICAHILTGHRIADLLGVVAASASSGAIVKSFSATPHPHRVSLVLRHPHGHVYPTYTVCDALSKYVAAPREPHEPLFDVSNDEVLARMDELGLDDVAPSDIRHIAARRIAADILSKLPRPDLSSADGLDQLKANLATASYEVAKRFGHDPGQGSFVHPSLALAYAEMCNGKALWPNVFKSEGVCFPPKPESFSFEACNLASPMQEFSSVSMNPTTLPQTPTSTQLQKGSSPLASPALPSSEEGLAEFDKSLGEPDVRRFERMMASLKPEKNWKIGRAILKLSALAKRARQGDMNAVNAIDDLLRLIQSNPDHGFDVVVSKSDEVPGPSGDPIGTVSQHDDGSMWEKREDGWHELGQGKRGLNKKNKEQAGGPASSPGDESRRKTSAAYAQARAVLAKLKAMHDATSDAKERSIIAKQIAIVRTRISALERSFDAGAISPPNQTKPRDVNMSEYIGSIFTELRSLAGRFSDMNTFCNHLCTEGTSAQMAEFRALVDEYRHGAESIIKGWLKC